MLDKDLRELLALRLRTNSVEFLVVGGHAVAPHGRPGLIEDLDLFARPGADNGQRTIEALRALGFRGVPQTALSREHAAAPGMNA